MSHYRLLLSIVISIFLVQIPSTQSTPTQLLTGLDDYPRSRDTFLDYVSDILDEIDPYARTIRLNQLREHLNHLCITGIFGSSRARACQRLVEPVDASSEPHGIQKRLFCNGFIGCKNAGD